MSNQNSVFPLKIMNYRTRNNNLNRRFNLIEMLKSLEEMNLLSSPIVDEEKPMKTYKVNYMYANPKEGGTVCDILGTKFIKAHSKSEAATIFQKQTPIYKEIISII